MKTETPAILAALVDRLATIKAQLATLADEESQIKAQLAASGLATIEGQLHRAAVSHCEGRLIIDWKTIAEHFNPSRQLIKAHAKIGAPYVSVRVSARKG